MSDLTNTVPVSVVNADTDAALRRKRPPHTTLSKPLARSESAVVIAGLDASPRQVVAIACGEANAGANRLMFPQGEWPTALRRRRLDDGRMQDADSLTGPVLIEESHIPLEGSGFDRTQGTDRAHRRPARSAGHG